jgi:hypothetical protein
MGAGVQQPRELLNHSRRRRGRSLSVFYPNTSALRSRTVNNSPARQTPHPPRSALPPRPKPPRHPTNIPSTNKNIRYAASAPLRLSTLRCNPGATLDNLSRMVDSSII